MASSILSIRANALATSASTTQPARRNDLKGETEHGEEMFLTFHALRAGFATLAKQAGQDQRVVSDLMGHGSTAFTERVYQNAVLPQMAGTTAAVWDLMAPSEVAIRA